MEANDLLVLDAGTGELSLSPRMDTNRQLEASYQTCVSGKTEQLCVSGEESPTAIIRIGGLVELKGDDKWA